MFSSYLKFFISCFQKIFQFFKTVTVDNNFTYFDFLVCLALAGLILIIFKLIKADYVADRKFLDHMDRVERYKENKNKMHRENVVTYTERKRSDN